MVRACVRVGGGGIVMGDIRKFNLVHMGTVYSLLKGGWKFVG